MREVREKLRKAIDQQRHLEVDRSRVPSSIKAESAFRPVREAAEELHDELSDIPDLKISIGSDSIWIELYDKHLWFGYDVEQRAFVGEELDSPWIEGGLREEIHKWDTAEKCIDAMILACARYVSLAHAITRLRSGGGA